jgi:hypothetical protein
MLSIPFADRLRHEGFELIGRLDYRLHLTVWWNPEKLIQVVILTIGPIALVRGDKSYYLKSISAEGETWVRDIPALHDYLESHFPELRLSFSHFRNVPASLTAAEVARRMAVEAPTLPTVDDIAQLQSQLLAKQRDARSAEGMMALSGSGPDLLSSYMRQQTRMQQGQMDQLKEQIERQQRRLNLLQHLQREHEQKGSAASYAFSVSSNVLFAEDAPRFGDALAAVVKELMDMHRYQVTQKLGGGRLNIQVGEAKEPAVAWIEQWFGGALAPMQMRGFSSAFDALRRASEQNMIVTPDQPIVTADHVRWPQKHLAARVVSDFLQRLDKTEAAAQRTSLSPESILPDAMPLALGYRVEASGKMLGPVAFPLNQMVHLFVSGTTGSGKSFLARVLIEEAARHQQLSVLVLDPRNQSIGLLVPEDRPKIIERYQEFAMAPKDARGFAFNYFAPGLPYADPPPKDLSQLSHGRSIVSFKGLDDQQRCGLVGKILEAVFAACNVQESETPRLLIVVDEAHLLIRRRLDESAKEAAAGAERALDRIAREGRKFGIILAIITQAMKDFGYDLASIRQMATTKLFLRNSERDVEFASDFIGDGRLLAQLPTGEALIHNANWGLTRLRVRPPCSKVFELAEAEVRQLVGKEKDPSKTVTSEARKLYEMIQQHGSPVHEPLNLSQAADLAGITSKRKMLELVGELEQAGAIRTKQLLERGRPRIIELTGAKA